PPRITCSIFTNRPQVILCGDVLLRVIRPIHAACSLSTLFTACSPVGSECCNTRASSGSYRPFLNLSAKLLARDFESGSPCSAAINIKSSRILFFVSFGFTKIYIHVSYTQPRSSERKRVKQGACSTWAASHLAGLWCTNGTSSGSGQAPTSRPYPSAVT